MYTGYNKDKKKNKSKKQKQKPNQNKMRQKILNNNEIKAIARHEITIDLDEVISSAAKVLKNKGYFYNK